MSSPQAQPHDQGVGASLELLEPKVPVEGDRVVVVEGDIEVDTHGTAASKVLDEPIDQVPTKSLAANPFEQVDVEMRRKCADDGFPDRRRTMEKFDQLGIG